MEKGELPALVSLTLEKDFDDLKNGVRTWQLVKEDEKYFFRYPHSDTLVDIFSNIQNDLASKKLFVNLLVGSINDSSEAKSFLRSKYTYASTCSISFYTLVRLGFVEAALDALEVRSHLQYSFSVFGLISSILSEDRSYFTIQQVVRLIDIVNKLTTFSSHDAQQARSEALGLLRHVGYESVKKSVKGINLEINKDKEEVKRLIGHLGFDAKYTKLLNEIDTYINTESEVLSAGMIGNLRSFMEDMLTDVAKKISSKINEEIPKYEGENLKEMGRVRKFLKLKLELSEKDNSFINGYINILHAEGGHTFVSNKTYFRLARNIGIEIALFVLSKYDEKFSK